MYARPKIGMGTHMYTYTHVSTSHHTHTQQTSDAGFDAATNYALSLGLIASTVGVFVLMILMSMTSVVNYIMKQVSVCSDCG
jgi:hypothetical protein